MLRIQIHPHRTYAVQVRSGFKDVTGSGTLPSGRSPLVGTAVDRVEKVDERL